MTVPAAAGIRIDSHRWQTWRVKSALFAASGLVAALAWTVALIVNGDPFGPAGVVLIGLGMLATATVATIGMVVVGGRWAHRLGLTALAITLVLAGVRRIDTLWIVALAASGLALAAFLSSTVTRAIRKLPAAAGPPPRAVLPPLILLVTPALLGLVGQSAEPWALVAVGASAPMTAFLYSRVLPGGLIAIRVVWPLLALALSPWLGWLAGGVAVAVAATVAVLSWHGTVKASYHPPREVGSTFPIPPELAPKEVLDAARIDDKGRPV